MRQEVKEPWAVVFGPFRFDLARARLWRGGEAVSLRAKPLAVLRYLVERPGQLVARGELLRHVWAGTYVTTTALRVCLRELRLALGDDARTPHYIETVGRQGYRFIAPLTVPSAAHGSSLPTPTAAFQGLQQQPPTYFVGREQELARLGQWFEAAQAGHRRLVFVTGEPGIGKTALLNMFLSQIQQTGSLWLAHGQCVEQYGGGTPYLPLLDALGRLCQEPGAAHLVRLFEQVAPMWLAQLPALLSAEHHRTLSSTVTGGARARMLYELADVLAALSTERPVVLVLEDLHWSDSATVEVLAYIARRPEQARLLVLGAYRPADLVVSEHPLHGLRQELFAHELGEELRLELLSEEEVEAYVAQRLVGNPLTSELSSLIYQRTDGNALFVVALVDYFLQLQQNSLREAARRRLAPEEIAALQTDLPEGLQQLILKHVERLSPEERRCLEVASVVGLHFTAAAVAATEQIEQERVETICDGLARKQQLIKARSVEELPSGSLTASYEFQHAVHQHVTYHRVGPMRQVRLHRALGQWLEEEYGAQAGEIASQLAVHFERGRGPRRAAHYHRLAAEYALRQNAYREGRLHGAAGLSLLEKVSDSTECKQLKLALLQLVSATLEATGGFLDEDLALHLQRARRLCHELHDDSTLASVLLRLGRRQLLRADRAAMEEIGQAQYHLVERVQDAKILALVYPQLVTVATIRGWHVRAAEHYQDLLQHFDPNALPDLLPSFGGDPRISASSWSSVSISLAGQVDLGWRRSARALISAEELRQPYALTNGLLCAAIVRILRGDYDEAWRLAHKLDALTEEHRFSLFQLVGALLQGCIAVQRHASTEGIARITAGLSQYRAVGAQLLIPFFLSFLAQGYWRQGKIAEALQVVHEALALTAANLDVFWEAELYRLVGELTLQQQLKVESQKSKVSTPQHLTPNAQVEAEAYFLKAIDIARQQGAKLLELRATTSLARLRQQQTLNRVWRTEQRAGSKKPEAQTAPHLTRNTHYTERSKLNEALQMLSEVYNWFTEGFDTKDLQEAKALLEALA